METGGAEFEKLRRYAELLAEWNKKIRVTGPGDADAIFAEHVMDAYASVFCLEEIPPGGSFADVGTGGGLPGIVWAICRPDLNAFLIDSVGKKIFVTREIAESLGIKNVTAVVARSEDFCAEKKEFFDLAAARGVTRSEILAEYLSPLVRVGGRAVALKGPNAGHEISLPENAWMTLGLAAPRLAPYSAAGKKLRLVTWKKIFPCPPRFPRRAGEALKNPWTSKIAPQPKKR